MKLNCIIYKLKGISKTNDDISASTEIVPVIF